jgi:D-glycero-alpha-D-manno-heptose 1-phosphate guanylyltransferase
MSSSTASAPQPPDAIILAGGLGTRLRAVLPDRQKVIAPVAGEPFLSRILRNFQIAGVTRVVLALGYRADDVIEAIGSLVPAGMTVIPSVEPQPMGTGGAIRRALALIGTDEVLVANGDSVIDYPLGDLIEFHRRCHSRATLLLCEVPDISRYGAVAFDATSKKILSFEEKQVGNHYPGIINAGVYMMARTLIEGFPESPHALETEILPRLCGHGLYGLDTRAQFIDIGTPEDYVKATKFFCQLNRGEP